MVDHDIAMIDPKLMHDGSTMDHDGSIIYFEGPCWIHDGSMMDHDGPIVNHD